MNTQETTFRLAPDILEALRYFAHERRESPDHLVEEALRIALHPLRQEALQRLNREIRRQNTQAAQDQSRHRTAQLSHAEEDRLTELLGNNRDRGLKDNEQTELQHIYDRIEEVATERAAAISISNVLLLSENSQ